MCGKMSIDLIEKEKYALLVTKIKEAKDKNRKKA